MLIHTTMKPWHSGYINEFIPLSLLFYTESSDGRSNQVVPIYDCIGVATLPPAPCTGTPQSSKIWIIIQNIGGLSLLGKSSDFNLWLHWGRHTKYHQHPSQACQSSKLWIINQNIGGLSLLGKSNDSYLRLYLGCHSTTSTLHRHALVAQKLNSCSKYQRIIQHNTLAELIFYSNTCLNTMIYMFVTKFLTIEYLGISVTVYDRYYFE